MGFILHFRGYRAGHVRRPISFSHRQLEILKTSRIRGSFVSTDHRIGKLVFALVIE